MALSLKVLLVGNGGREHALAWKLCQSPLVSDIYVCPGNGGSASLPKTQNVDSPKASDFPGLVAFAKEKHINLLVPGPEAPLVDGIADYFAEHASTIHCFGPSKKAAVMEGSKTFSKDFMKRHRIPTASYENFSDHAKASEYLDIVWPSHHIVIKASGLAAGKGVIIPQTINEAHEELKKMMLDKEFGNAGDEVVIEEFLEGHEISILSFCDGDTVKSLPPAQDHKRIGEGDTGPNTGGMGTYAPAPAKIVSKQVLDQIETTVLQPTIEGMKKEGFPFVGCLFTGLMITKNGPRVLEYNVRFGDPETQSLLPLLETDLAEIMLACTTRRLREIYFQIAPRSAVTVVIASKGYPGSYPKDVPMTIKDSVKDVILFHAGTTLSIQGQLTTSGGRVIASTGVAGTLAEAKEKAYKGVRSIQFEGMQHRRDIGDRALR